MIIQKKERKKDNTKERKIKRKKVRTKERKNGNTKERKIEGKKVNTIERKEEGWTKILWAYEREKKTTTKEWKKKET